MYTNSSAGASRSLALEIQFHRPETHPAHVTTVEIAELVSDNTCLTGCLLVLYIRVLNDVGFEIVVERNTNYAMLK
jgi:hypothetical protein